MPRYKLTLEYDGRDFVGWQRQDNGTAIQELVEDAIARFSGKSATTIAAGRTDAGVQIKIWVLRRPAARENVARGGGATPAPSAPPAERSIDANSIDHWYMGRNPG